MPSSWISKSDGAEIRLAHPHNRAGMAVMDLSESFFASGGRILKHIRER